ncbi:unnamed protein product [Penicillium olsonii]|uniref:Kelch repeat protein n=1 Tax=Penicillium olsonii TaxID=99116 RepID=A0A9W4HME3_PENOL|nr:unnamed protein product [Penicillium olsonii]CAG8094625.1 unnamed protein product [Penicillium olsonii]CAG8290434.1 unnamed protein product [Penicillium olsonii]
MAKINAICHNVMENEVLRRSSQVLSVIGDRAYVFGGELRPREPRDNDVHVVSLGSGNTTITSEPATSTSPSPRVGTAACTLNGKIYIFSGRGGVAMAPIEEQGAVWEFDPATAKWSLILPADTSAKTPVARSYHCTASDGEDTLYLHAGCPEKGRLSDLWAFSLSRRVWTELSPASDPPRGGASIAFADGRLYRMNGFDGNTEQGGSLDIYSLETASWTSHVYSPDGKAGPAARSVSCLLPLRLNDRPFLVTLFGEHDPSSLGHQGAGKMLSDIWAFDMERQGWEEVAVHGDRPLARGWFDADVIGNTIVVHGGLGESNDRLGDVWTIELSG